MQVIVIRFYMVILSSYMVLVSLTTLLQAIVIRFYKIQFTAASGEIFILELKQNKIKFKKQNLHIDSLIFNIKNHIQILILYFLTSFNI